MNMKKRNWFWGIFFIAAAVLLIAGNFWDFAYINVWTFVLTILLLAALLKSIRKKNISGVIFAVAFLCMIYAKPLGIANLSPWTILAAALLLSIGVSFLYHPGKKEEYHHMVTDHDFKEIETVDENTMHFDITFGSGIKYINTDDFRGAKAECSFGGMKLYFDNALMQAEQAVLEVDLTFAGLEIYLPKEWELVNRTSAVFGGVKVENRHQGDCGHQLVLTGDVVFGGVTVIYV